MKYYSFIYFKFPNVVNIYFNVSALYFYNLFIEMSVIIRQFRHNLC